jgi:hypothetical protein
MDNDYAERLQAFEIELIHVKNKIETIKREQLQELIYQGAELGFNLEISKKVKRSKRGPMSVERKRAISTHMKAMWAKKKAEMIKPEKTQSVDWPRPQGSPILK